MHPFGIIRWDGKFYFVNEISMSIQADRDVLKLFDPYLNHTIVRMFLVEMLTVRRNIDKLYLQKLKITEDNNCYKMPLPIHNFKNSIIYKFIKSNLIYRNVSMV